MREAFSPVISGESGRRPPPRRFAPRGRTSPYSPEMTGGTYISVTSLSYNHMISRAYVFLDSLLSEHIIQCHMCSWGRLLPCYNTRFFLQRGCCCQGKEVVPVDHIRGKGLSSCLTSGSKIRLTAGFELCPQLQGPAPSSLAAAHSPF